MNLALVLISHFVKLVPECPKVCQRDALYYFLVLTLWNLRQIQTYISLFWDYTMTSSTYKIYLCSQQCNCARNANSEVNAGENAEN